MNCADCNSPIGQDDGPPGGWRLEDGRAVCHACCSVDTGRVLEQMRQICRWLTELETAGTIPPAVGVEPQGNITKHN